MPLNLWLKRIEIFLLSACAFSVLTIAAPWPLLAGLWFRATRETGIATTVGSNWTPIFSSH